MTERNKIVWIWISICNYLVIFLVLPFSVLELTTETICKFFVAGWCFVFTILIMRRGYKASCFVKQIVLFYPLVMIYHPRGIYGIFSGGMLDFSPAWLDALAFVLLVSIAQFLFGMVITRIRK